MGNGTCWVYCRHCSAGFEYERHPGTPGRPRLYCSTRCKAAAKRARIAAQRRDAVRQCPTCCKWFTTESRPGRPKEFCSDYCRNWWREGGQVRPSWGGTRTQALCRWCGTSFMPTNAKSVRCLTCRHKPARVPWRACVVCARMFRSTQRADVCSGKCRAALKAMRETQAQREMRRVRERNSSRRWRHSCRACGFQWWATSHNSAALCRECSAYRERLLQSVRYLVKHHRDPFASQPSSTTCEFCGDPTGTSRKRFCSNWCSEASRGRRALHSAIEYGECLRCGRTFAGRAGCMGSFCSDRCSKRARKRHRRHLERSQRPSNEPLFTLRQVAERDGWRCHLCGKQVPDREYAALPLDPTIDHLVPLAHGGAHSLENVALAHNRCNWQRSDGGVAQLRLIA